MRAVVGAKTRTTASEVDEPTGHGGADDGEAAAVAPSGVAASTLHGDGDGVDAAREGHDASRIVGHLRQRWHPSTPSPIVRNAAGDVESGDEERPVDEGDDAVARRKRSDVDRTSHTTTWWRSKVTALDPHVQR